ASTNLSSSTPTISRKDVAFWRRVGENEDVGIEAIVLVGAVGFLIVGCTMGFGAETDPPPAPRRRCPFTIVRIRHLDDDGEVHWRVGWN
ncbi:MAG: hypothetical protein ABR975_16185, partial [Vulcanimicrobiaceae bacterium]